MKDRFKTMFRLLPFRSRFPLSPFLALLTWFVFAFSLKEMRLARATLVALLGTGIAAYVVDCSGMTTPAEAMKCCQSMPCSSSGHSQKCCEAMPQVHAPFVQPPSAQGLSFTRDLIAVVSIFQEPVRSCSAAWQLASNCHAPPGSSPPTSIPIRI